MFNCAPCAPRSKSFDENMVDCGINKVEYLRFFLLSATQQTFKPYNGQIEILSNEDYRNRFNESIKTMSNQLVVPLVWCCVSIRHNHCWPPINTVKLSDNMLSVVQINMYSLFTIWFFFFALKFTYRTTKRTKIILSYNRVMLSRGDRTILSDDNNFQLFIDDSVSYLCSILYIYFPASPQLCVGPFNVHIKCDDPPICDGSSKFTLSLITSARSIGQPGEKKKKDRQPFTSVFSIVVPFEIVQ